MSVATTAVDREWITPDAAGRMLGVCGRTVLRYASQWNIGVWPIPSRQRNRQLISLADVVAFKARRDVEARARFNQVGPADQRSNPEPPRSGRGVRQ
jgi:hypothetical protein